jgi:hypothetical protein
MKLICWFIGHRYWLTFRGDKDLPVYRCTICKRELEILT